MSEFYSLTTKVKSGVIEVYPSFKIKARDIVTKGGEFYAVYDENTGLWSRDEEMVVNLVDNDIYAYITENQRVNGAFLNDSESGSWVAYRKYIGSKPNSPVQFDSKLLFADHELVREDYATRKLSYSPKKGSTKNFNKIINTLYDQQEAEKIKWFIGALLTGDSAKIQKFAVFFGPPGSGKSTVINIMQKMVEGYSATFKAKDLVSSSNQFGTAAFKENPILAVEHDSDLSKIEDNAVLNSLVSHESTILNEKYTKGYQFTFNGLIVIGSNKPVKITDSKSGLLRRILDIIPSGIQLSYEDYINTTSKVEFEIPAIAYECMEVYREMGIDYYINHRPLKMMELTDFFYDFILSNLPVLKNGVTLRHATELYVKYCDDNKLDVKAPRQKVKAQLEDYFLDYAPTYELNGNTYREYYYNFNESKITAQKYEPKTVTGMKFSTPYSYLDNYCVNCLAQLANENGSPYEKWSNVKTTLADIDTKCLHWLKPANPNHIVIDFDLKDETGKKSLALNVAAANKFPKTYAEISKSGTGVHLHYIYDGDVDDLAPLYSEDIEIKRFKGRSSLRRKFSYSNGINTITTISVGLPLKEKKEEEVLNKDILITEKVIRKNIYKCLRKEHHGATAPEIDFIEKILNDAIAANIQFDVTDLRPSILNFAINSSNQSQKCIVKVNKMIFQNGMAEEILDAENTTAAVPKEDLTFYDIEVFPNLVVIVIKRYGCAPIRYYNPTAQEVEAMLTFNLIGFNCRQYDNHIMYALMNGYDAKAIFELNEMIIANSPNAKFMNAYNLSYADLYEYSAKKQSLKKWEIELDIVHDECEFPWGVEVPEEHWERVGDYCEHDVCATEAVFDATYADYVARLIIAELSGLPINSKTQAHAAQIIFEGNKNPQSEFVYTDLSEMFPGYKYEFGKSTYRGYDVGEGGWVKNSPGIYSGLVGLMDINSQHPTSGGELNCFGKYTKNYVGIKDIRLNVKNKRLDEAKVLARQVFGNGKLDKYLNDKDLAKDLAYALKIVINIVYGMTSASYDNPFKDPRNVDNILAKRGALFMIDLYETIKEMPGYEIIHVKTDSVKVYPFDEKIENFIYNFGKQYGYTFDTEAIYDKFILMDKAQYFCREVGSQEWHSTGKLPSEPYIFHSLCPSDKMLNIPKDVSMTCESKSGPIYIGDRFVGKNAHVVPVLERYGQELRVLRDNKEVYVPGTKGYQFMLYSDFKTLEYSPDTIDWDYFDKKVIDTLHKIVKVDKAMPISTGIYNAFEWDKIDPKFHLEEFNYN